MSTKNLSNIKLKKSFNFTEIEKLTSELLEKKPEKLQIANSLSYSGGFGMEGAALQFFATWLRCSNSQILHTAIQKLQPDSFEDLCNSLFGLCVLRLSDSIHLSSMDRVALADALRPAIPIFEKIRSEDFKSAFKGMYFTLPAIKADVIKGGKDREFDSPIYNNNEVVGHQKFQKLTQKSLEVIFPKASNIDISITNHLSEIIRELFTNTHRHARTDVNGNPLEKNFRGIIFNSISINAKRLDEISKSGGGKLALFVADWRPKDNKQFRALDITIVDSGPGYARRWHGLDKDQLNLQLEKEAIVECFKKYNSTDEFDSAGSGLSNVLSDLRTLKGWFRLRTGRTLVEKSFFKQEGRSTISADDIQERKNFLEGVVFNVVIPLQSLRGDI